MFLPVPPPSLLTAAFITLPDVTSRHGHRVPDSVDSSLLLRHRASQRSSVARNSSTVFLLSTCSPRIEPDMDRREIYCWMSIHGVGVVTHIAFSSPGPFWCCVHHVRSTAGTEITHRTSLVLLVGVGSHRGGLLPLLDGVRMVPSSHPPESVCPGLTRSWPLFPATLSHLCGTQSQKKTVTTF